jgi:hypothetical protein
MLIMGTIIPQECIIIILIYPLNFSVFNFIKQILLDIKG